MEALTRLLTRENCGGKWIPIVAVNPDTVCSPESILVCALRTVGVQLHPAFGFQKFTDEHGDAWRWMVAEFSTGADPYETSHLIKWWNDPAWLSAHPQHEWTVLKNGLTNMARQSREIRDQVTLLVLRRAKSEAHISVKASNALRDFRIAQLEGKIPIYKVFTGPMTLEEESALAERPETRN